MNSSLEVYNSDGAIFFERDGKWLHPLFALMEHLERSEIIVTNEILRDKIIGAAAATLIIKMGFKKCHGELMSEKAIEMFRLYNVEYSYDKLVEKILCRTEKLINPETGINDLFKQLNTIYRSLRQ